MLEHERSYMVVPVPWETHIQRPEKVRNISLIPLDLITSLIYSGKLQGVRPRCSICLESSQHTPGTV